MRNWFITGVSSGLGRALAVAALDAGDSVAGTVRNAAAARDFTALHPTRAFAFEADVTDHAAVAAAIAAAEEKTGGIGVVVNNAGYSFMGTTEEAAWPDIRAQFETNLFGAIAVMKAALPAMRARRAGAIINVTSTAGYFTGGGIGFYAASKLALEGISKALHHELQPFGIAVMLVVPGAYRTALGDNRANAAETIPDYAPQNALRRERMARYTGHQRGDAAKAAAVILNAVAARPVPRYLVLGPDGYEFVKMELDAFSADMAAWEAVATATDLEAQ